jgi:hypothetical protein
MIRIIALVIALTLQGGDDKKEAPKRTLPAGWNKLGLSEAQKQKVFATRAEYWTTARRGPTSARSRAWAGTWRWRRDRTG